MKIKKTEISIPILGKIIPDKKLENRIVWFPEKVKNTKLDNKIRNNRNGGITQK